VRDRGGKNEELPADGVHPCRKQYLAAAEVVESLRRHGLQDWKKSAKVRVETRPSDGDRRLKIGLVVKVCVWKKCHGCTKEKAIKDSFA
jgi:hypothetical protein